jgi:hypothetical protein
LTVHNGRHERQQEAQTEAVPAQGRPRHRSAATDHGDQTPSSAGRKRRTTIQVAPPAVVAMDGDDERQAVTAIATMIAAWWHDHQHDPPE